MVVIFNTEVSIDGEITAIRTALSQLQCHLENSQELLSSVDSRAALLAIVSDSIPKTQDILDCRYHLENLASLEKAMRKPISWLKGGL
ncbi:hypothetical protein CEXT_247061 [Caerostris extrusa]|uniref:Uncharacterized protein n=1 Tax=Caerostris extrusa TaxID=172846 RepID=A0AAV4S234_CAEEX|nr:hypothetical protein CEXT_247061 [Caerostris extrusa]